MLNAFCWRSPTSSSHKESLSSRTTSLRLRFADKWLQIKLCSGGDWNIGGCSKEPRLDDLDQPEEAREVDQHQPAGRHKPSAASTKHWIQRANRSTVSPSSTRPHPICSPLVRVRRVPDCEPSGEKLTREYDSWNSAQNLEQEEESAPFIETCSTPEEAFSVQVVVDDQTFVASCTKPRLAWREAFKNKCHAGCRGESCDNPEAAQHPTQRTEGEKRKEKNQKIISNPVCNTDPSVQNFPILLLLGKGSNNQNGNLRWHLPLGVQPPPPLMAQISRHFFTPLFFFCNWILHIWNGFYTSKISLLSPLINGSKLTFSGCCDRRLPYFAMFIVTSTTIYT